MPLPLYQEVQIREPSHDRQHRAGHTGLWFQKFYNGYAPGFASAKANESAVKDWLSTFHHPCGDTDLLESAVARQVDLVSALDGAIQVFKCSWHFVTGMGNEHPIENGFSWHPVWGTPYLPGSSLKGMVRTWVEAWMDDPEFISQKRTEKLKHWFGSDSKDSTDIAAGSVIFFDAIPLKPLNLATDIMTPHMGEWYASGDQIQDVTRDSDKVPADWHSPNPILFLTAKTPVFLISIAPRAPNILSPGELDEIQSCLVEAFDWLGAGAKTAVGYGQFTADKSTAEALKVEAKLRSEKRDQKKALHSFSGIELELRKHAAENGWANSKEAFFRPGELEGWLQRLDEEPSMNALAYLVELLEKHCSGLLANPEKTKGKRPSFVFSDRQRQLAKSVLTLMRRGA